MKAAVIQHFGDTPNYKDFKDPSPDDRAVLICPRFVPIENFDKLVVAGKHFASANMFPDFPAIAGHSGVGATEDGQLVSFGGIEPPYGCMAERAVVPEKQKNRMAPIPEGIDPAIAAALPASAMTSLLPLKWSVQLKKGETVFINGATGVSGRLAVQIGKLLGAGQIIGTGRNPESLARIKSLGADETISLDQSENQVSDHFYKIVKKGIDVILDFTWGKPTELLLKSFIPDRPGFARHQTRYVQIGASAGQKLNLPPSVLRNTGLVMSGAGNIPMEAVSEATELIWKWTKEKKISMEVVRFSLSEISEAWHKKIDGKRIVIEIE